MNELIITVGLPRSGKSSWAQAQNYPIVNPDAIRLGLHGQPFIGEAEPFVWAIAQVMVRALFNAGHHTVVVDATNTSRKRRDFWKSRAWRRRFVTFGGPEMQEECMQRALAQYPLDEQAREGLVNAIIRMADTYEDPTNDELTEEEGA